MDYGIRHIENWDWVTLTLVGTFVILAITRYLYPRRFQEFLLLPLTDKYFKLQGKGYEIKHPFNVLMFVIQLISLSLFAFFLLNYSDPGIFKENPWLFVQIITGLGVFVLMKFFSEKIIAHIFNIEEVINAYLYEKLSYASIISLLVLVANVILYFALKPRESVLIGFTLVLAVLYLISLISSFKRNWIIILRHFSYFILYLCALEIAPYIILYHLLI